MNADPSTISPQPPDDETIEKWADAAKKGDEKALEQLIKTFAPSLQQMIYRMLLDWDETRDVAQETFIRLYRALPRYHAKGRFKSWLFQIGARLALDASRRRKRRPAAEHKENETEKSMEDPHVLRNELMEAIEQAVKQLPAIQRTAFIMAEHEGCSLEEIAAVTGKSVKSVEMHLYRARAALREELKPFL